MDFVGNMLFIDKIRMKRSIYSRTKINQKRADKYNCIQCLVLSFTLFSLSHDNLYIKNCSNTCNFVRKVNSLEEHNLVDFVVSNTCFSHKNLIAVQYK